MEVDHSLDAADHRSLVDHSDIPLGRHVGRRAVHFDARRTVHQESLSYSDRIDRTVVDYGAAGLGKKLLGRYHVGVLGSDNPIVGEASGLGEAGEEEDKTAIHEVDYLGRAGPEILGSAGVDSRSNSGGMKKEEGGPLKNGCRQEDDKSAHHRQSMIQHRCWNTRNFGSIISGVSKRSLKFTACPPHAKEKESNLTPEDSFPPNMCATPPNTAPAMPPWWLGL